MGIASQGLKAGLAAGVIYGLLVGLLHLSTLELCSQNQVQFIATQLLKQPPGGNVTAQDLFATDLVYFPMIFGIVALIYGVVYGVIFSFLYGRIPGSSSKRKGMVFALPVFVIGIFAGPAAFSYDCSPSFVPLLSLAAGLPVSLAFGYVLGVFFDSFGRLAQEQREEEERRRAQAET